MTRSRDKLHGVYLVTGREFLPPGIDYYEFLDQCLRNRDVNIVQIREKHTETSQFLEIARRSLEICAKYGVKMVINDNLAVCLALPESVGLHIGQEDIPILEARRLLGPDRILGISVNTVEQAHAARASGAADYAGVGPCYGTQSKSGITEEKIIGVAGAQAIVAALATNGPHKALPSFLIGGINQATALRALFGASSTFGCPDGIAVISALMARLDPDVAARELYDITNKYSFGCNAAVSSNILDRFEPAFLSIQTARENYVAAAADMLTMHRGAKLGPPLIQTITSHVSSTMSANMALAFSSSPIMSHEAEEAADLSKAIGALVLNIGTISESSRQGMRVAGTSANHNGKPVVLDPVGGGATQFRKKIVREILNHTQITLLKGNAAELASIAGNNEVQSRGVDSGTGSLTDPVKLVVSLARKERCLVLLSGQVDYLTDGKTVIASHNGHPYLGAITGSGCALGVTVAAGLAAACRSDNPNAYPPYRMSNLMVRHGSSDLLVGALIGLLSMTIASEKAAQRADVKGPGTFIPALQDELAAISAQDILQYARIEVQSYGLDDFNV